MHLQERLLWGFHKGSIRVPYRIYQVRSSIRDPSQPGQLPNSVISTLLGWGSIYGHALGGPSPPLHGLWSRMPPLLWDGVWVPSSPCGVVVGVLGLA